MASHRLGLLDGLLLLFSFSSYLTTTYAAAKNLRVTIPQGTLQGTTLKTRHDRHISAFLGIPYAQPPIGNLRFANPVAAHGWDGILNATTDGNSCPHISGNSVNGNEDCLFINVYTPQLPKIANSTLLPVMLYIHGGAFKYGSSSSTHHGPGFLMDKDIVYVAINYRLGLLGFLSTGDEIASGNWGLKDQVLALQWVQNNIEYFGGDPDQVTLFGESAGAACIHILTLSDATIGLFHRYITQSGSALSPWAYRPRLAYSSRAFQLGNYVGCSNHTAESLISCLRTIDTSDIMAANLRFLIWQSFPDIIWGPTDEPVMDGAILTDSPTNLFASGKIRDLPWLLGVDRDEGLLFSRMFHENEETFDDFMKNIDFLLPIILSWTYQPDSGAVWLNATKSYYLNTDLTTNKSEILSNLTMLMGDSHFLYPTYNGLRIQHLLAKSPQYFYSFNYHGTYSINHFYDGSEATYGVAHSDELMYLFQIKSPSSHGNNGMSVADYRIVDVMVQLWTSFVINGTPSTFGLEGNTTWEPYSNEDNYLKIGNETDVSLESECGFHRDRMQFWAALNNIVREPATATVT